MSRVSLTIASLLVVHVLFGGAAIAAQPGEQGKPVAARASAAPAAPVNLNTATQAQLETLPGIGAATAKRILEYRQKSGKDPTEREAPKLLHGYISHASQCEFAMIHGSISSRRQRA